MALNPQQKHRLAAARDLREEVFRRRDPIIERLMRRSRDEGRGDMLAGRAAADVWAGRRPSLSRALDSRAGFGLASRLASAGQAAEAGGLSDRLDSGIRALGLGTLDRAKGYGMRDRAESIRDRAWNQIKSVRQQPKTAAIGNAFSILNEASDADWQFQNPFPW